MKMAGLKKVKKEQRRAIHDFVSSRDVFVSLPTGYGKSFCYALLPTVLDLLRSSIDCDLCFAADCHTNAGSSLRYWWSLVRLCWYYIGRHSCNLLCGSLMMFCHLLT